jgi:hypothetical protein
MTFLGSSKLVEFDGGRCSFSDSSFRAASFLRLLKRSRKSESSAESCCCCCELSAALFCANSVESARRRDKFVLNVNALMVPRTRVCTHNILTTTPVDMVVFGF